jgi:hypothetical protein
MAYRDETGAARERRDALRRELTEVERAIEGRDALARRRAELARGIEEAEREIGRARARVALPLLASVRVASPCHARWDDMRGDDHARHCGQCDKTVFDLSSLTAEDAEALLRSRGESLCVRFHRRADGTVMTSDCPIGAARGRRRGWALAAGMAVVAGAGAAAGLAMVTTMGAPDVASADAPCDLDDGAGTVWMGQMVADPTPPRDDDATRNAPAEDTTEHDDE